MNAASIIEDLHRRGIALSVADSKLRVNAPRGVLTAELLTELRVHKAELLAVLTGHQPAELVQELQSAPAPVLAHPPAFVHVACSPCRHLDGSGHCGAWNDWPIYPHLAIRLCGKYEVRGLSENLGKREGIPHA